MRIVRSLRFIACLTATGLTAFGQGVNGTITGTVTDPSGLVVPGAAVEATNVETGALYTAAATNTGNHRGSRRTLTSIWPSRRDKSCGKTSRCK